MSDTVDKILLRVLPPWLYQKLIADWHKDGFRKYFANTGWIFGAKLVTFTLSFITIAVVARYLGPDNYGKLSYAQSFVALFSAFAALGIDQILFRNLIAEPDKEDELLGTALVAKLVVGLVTLVVTIVTAAAMNSDHILTLMIGLIAVTFILQPWGVISHVFNARVLSRYISYTTIVAAFLLPALKLLVVFGGGGIIYFAGIVTFEALFFAVCYLYIYWRVLKRTPHTWQFSKLRLYSLMRDSWPLLFASLAGYIYGRIDQVMIHELLDARSVGFYDVAVRLTELQGFVPGIIIASVFPAIINAKERSQAEYHKRFASLTMLCVGISTVSALTIFLLAPYIITLLYGAEFHESISLVRIYVWSTIGTAAIILMQQYFVAENRSRVFLAISIFGAVSNIALNALLIPALGAAGAAYATLLTFGIIVALFFLLKKGSLKQK